MDIKRIPISAPLPCYAAAYSSIDAKCASCAHAHGCQELSGDKAARVTVANLRFSLIPPKFGKLDLDHEDPDYGAMQEIYVMCHNAVFGADTRDLVGPYRRDIAARAKEAELSLRTFMLACMFGHKSTSENAVGHTETKTRKFSPKSLTYASAPTSARAYAKLCRDAFGAFSLSALTALSGDDLKTNDFEHQMLTSETCAGTYIVGWKLKHDGEPYKSLYADREINLNPYWLATCPHYDELVLRPHLSNPYGSKLEQRQRSAVVHAVRNMSRSKSTAKAVFYARQTVAPTAVKNVLAFYGYRADDFEIDDTPVTDMLQLWLALSRVILHMEALKYVIAEPSALDRVFAEPRTL